MALCLCAQSLVAGSGVKQGENEDKDDTTTSRTNEEAKPSHANHRNSITAMGMRPRVNTSNTDSDIPTTGPRRLSIIVSQPIVKPPPPMLGKQDSARTLEMKGAVKAEKKQEQQVGFPLVT